MKIHTILTALAVLAVALAHPVRAEFTVTKGELTHVNDVPVPPMRTAAQARADAVKRIAAINAEEAKAVASEALVTRHSPLVTHPQDVFFTGKPYVEETGQYVFLFRHYDPELGRWTTSDPSGFPDGANGRIYIGNAPNYALDFQGLAKMTASQGVDHYLYGGGQTVSESFNDYYQDVNWGASHFDGFDGAYASATSGSINLTKLHNFGEQTAFGRLVFRLTGNVSMDSRYKYFVGEITLDGDWYDFDSKPWGERSLPAEVATRLGGFVLGDLLGGERFWGNFNGKHSISLRTPYE